MADSYGHNAGSPDSSPHSDNESGGHYRDHDASVREQDRFLPIANVSRIMKKALPSNAKISKDAKETVQECVSEFISFITGMSSIFMFSVCVRMFTILASLEEHLEFCLSVMVQTIM
jgi:hypothetical protein